MFLIFASEDGIVFVYGIGLDTCIARTNGRINFLNEVGFAVRL
jgi:hypothetical protein